MPIRCPSSLAHYEVIAPIGSGGMGEVYRARDKNLDRVVALKILPAAETLTGQAVRRFIQEAKAASALNHPNIAHIYEIGEADGIRFIAMEYVEGQSLQEKVSGRSLTGSEVLQIGCQIADALEHAHAARIIHRDIKSSNIMLTPRGQVKVLDFGLAKIQHDETTSAADIDTKLKTAPEVLMGTLPYMSPEQALGQRIDHRSDIFSFGVVLYQLITGRLPFSGKNSSETANLIATAQPEPISRFNHQVPVEFERIVRKCLEKETHRRYQTAADLAADLENLKRDSQTNVATGVSPVAPRRNRIAWRVGATALLVLVTLGTLYSIFKGNKSVATVAKVQSIAVLPFTNVTGDQSTEYLSDGITESIINSLSQLPNMRVMARTTMFRYKGQNADPQAVGRELGVDAVVTGKALHQGDTLVIQADLVYVSDGSQLWGDRFNRKFVDVLSIQEEISKQIAEKLRLRLTGEEQRLLTKRYTDSTEAYDLFLKGRSFQRKVTENDLLTAIDYYQQAIAKDPNYALAYVGVGNAYHTLGGVLGFRSPSETFPKMNEYAMKALQMDDQLAEAHHLLANAKLYYEWNWEVAGRELKRSIELNPNYSLAYETYGTYYQSLGLLDQAAAARKVGKELDPLSPFAVADEGYPLYYARRFDDAIKAYREGLALDQNLSWGHLWIGQALVQKGMYSEAIAEIQEAVRLSGGDIRARATLGHAYAVAGKQREALHVLDELKSLSRRRYVSPYFIALVYAGLRNDEETFAWLEKAYQERHPYLILLKVEPVFDHLRNNEKFINLEKRVGLNP
jgi:eukaryotic-like serine/threonine-protein kinase